MAISLNSVIHYPQTIDNLKGILSEGFRVKYCLEKVTGVPVAFPMVSFCDIPLSDALSHSENYGKFAIGLSKEWAVENNLNPVLYISDNSFLDQQFRTQSDRLNQEFRNGKVNDRFWLKQFNSLLSFVKSVQGTRMKDGILCDVNQYNEREWRYVPTEDQLKAVSIDGFPINFQIYGPTYQHNKDKINNYLRALRLKFQPKDISHIIVSDVDHAKQIITFIKQNYTAIPTDEIDLIITKVITMKQIAEDF